MFTKNWLTVIGILLEVETGRYSDLTTVLVPVVVLVVA